MRSSETLQHKTVLEYTNCNLCGGDDTILLFEIQEKITGNKERYNVVKCKNCGLVYTNPRPSKKSIYKYYQEESYYAYHPVKPHLKDKIKNMVMEAGGNYPTVKNGLQRMLMKLFYFILKTHVSIIVPYIENGRVLDIGCGCGNLLLWLKQHGWETYGIDISPKAVEVANKRGLKVSHGELTDIKYEADFFDVIVVNQVLEHVHDPMGLLREIRRILKPKGLLIIGTPNIDSYESRIFGKFWSPYDIPRHLYHFSLLQLEKMLEKTSFKIEKVVSKIFLIPHFNRESLNALKEGNKRQFIPCLLKLYFWKFIKYIFVTQKLTFGQIITIYARKIK